MHGVEHNGYEELTLLGIKRCQEPFFEHLMEVA